MRITPRDLTSDGFLPFGFVAGAGAVADTINQGRGRRTDLASFPASGRRTVVARSELVPSRLPFGLTLLERHPLSDQLFVSLGSAVALVIVTPSLLDGSPDLEDAQAFYAGPDTPFVYAAGTWHAPLVALDRAGSFLMCMTESGTASDCEFFEVTRSITVVAPGA